MERFVVNYLIDLEEFRLPPLVIAILLIYTHGFVMVPRYLMSVFVARSISVALQADLVDCSADCLGVANVSFALFPAILL